MSLIKTLLFGRENGIRARLRRTFGGGAPESQRPAPPARPVAAEKALNLGVEPPKDVTPPDGYEVVLHKSALKEGQVIEVITGGRALALAHVKGQYYASTNECPHAHGPLGEGTLDGTVLTCPYHGWKFDLKDGSCLTSAEDRIKTYPVQIVGEAVCVAF